MLKDFFKLNEPFEILDRKALVSRLQVGRHVRDVLYEPECLSDLKVTGVTFENVSFSKTTLSNMTFSGCTFKNCLFIGTCFESLNFHGCKFENCNFFKAKFHSVYARPHQFRRAIQHHRYANIAVHLYHQLRENYYRQSQREHKNEAEYYFLKWGRINNVIQAERNHKKWYSYLPQSMLSFSYDFFLGYGFRVRNLVRTSVALIVIAAFMNYTFSQHLFKEAVEPSVIKTIYFTLTTMATLGASGYSPDTDIGYLFVIANVVLGVSILSATVSAVFKKVMR